MKTLFLLVILLTSLLGGTALRAQPNVARAAFASDAAAARHRAAYAAVVRRAGFRFPAAMFYKCRIDVTKENALRHAGFDLRDLDRRIRIDGPGGFQESSLFADLVVRGTVLSLVTDSSRRVCYHSRYRVRVAETWQGRPADTVTVQLVTGPIGDSRGITFSGAPRLDVGEEAILHLRYVDFAGDAEAEKLGLSLCTNNAAPSDWLVVLATPVRGEEVLDSYGQRPIGQLADLRRQLQRIAAILDKEHFYQKAF